MVDSVSCLSVRSENFSNWLSSSGLTHVNQPISEFVVTYHAICILICRQDRIIVHGLGSNKSVIFH